MTILRVTAKLPYVTELPGDLSENVFHVLTPDAADSGDYATILELAEAFYNAELGDASVGSRLSPYITRSTGGCQIVIAQVDNSGSKDVVSPPVAASNFTLDTAVSSQSMPFEVAVCLTFGSFVMGVPRARTRGRVYIGPLCNDTLVADYATNVPPRVDSTFTFDLGLAAQAFGNALNAADLAWSVYSRGHYVDDPTAHGLCYPIEAGYVDNAFDTQRRREVDATLRDGWALA